MNGNLDIASPPLAWEPQTGPQSEAFVATWCEELFYGGAVGGGKSDLLLGDFAQDVDRYGRAWRGILFRRSYPRLEELMVRSREIYIPMGAEWLKGERLWTFPSGATLKLRFLERDDDVWNYWGHQYAWEGWDELPEWDSMAPYRFMLARLRSAAHIPTKRVRATGNPGGRCHHEVMKYFRIDTQPLGSEPWQDPKTKHRKMFIKSKLADNKILMHNDPGYADRLEGTGSPQRVRALKEGDWTVVEGAFFPEFGAKHIVEPCKLPAHWTRFRSFDWGSARPFSVGWWAVSDGELEQFPKGALVRYREWYGASGPNEGLRMTVEEVAAGIREREAPGERIRYSVADPAIFREDGGPSFAERFANKGVIFSPADNSRVQGWDQIRQRLRGVEDEVSGESVPLIYTFSTCKDSIRTLPALQHDTRKPEDIDTEMEDHAADEWRYGCMSRPFESARPKQAEEVLRPLSSYTFNEIIEMGRYERR